MVDVIGRAKVIITGDVDPRSIDQAGGKIGSRLRTAATVGVAALGSLAVGGTKAYLAFEKAEANSRKLTRVLTNMGESKAAPAVEKLADELRRLTGIDDDVIKSGQTVLATFDHVNDSAGELGGTFERATRLTVDMASVFGSVESGARILGKALEDPSKAAARLVRSNVILNDEQKKLIDTFVKAGDSAKAQDVILDALEDRYKGTAEESATQSKKIREALGEAGEAIGNVLDTLAGNKTEDGGQGKSLSERIDQATDSINKFAESPGLKEFLKNIDESNRSDFAQSMVEQNEKAAESIGNTIVLLSGIPGKLGEIRDDIADGGLFDGVSDQLEEADQKFADWWDERVAESKESREDIKRSLSNMVKDIKATPGKIADTVGDWKDAGSELVGGFIDGFFEFRGATRDIGQRIKDAINNALPDSITFFGGRDGIPTLSVPVPQFASGTRNFSGGLALVGERGPELVGLPAGSNVYSNQESRGMVGGGTMVNNFYGPMSGADILDQWKWANRFAPRFGAGTASVAG